MSKLTWGLGGIVALTATAVGGHLYTAQSLQSFYQQAGIQQSKKFTVQSKNFEMGLMRGSADWNAQLQLDPCKPHEVIQLQGKDQIQRSWDGYRIRSEIKVVQAEPSVQALFVAPLQADTRISWVGHTQTVLTMPAISRQVDKFQATVDPITVKIQARPKEQHLRLLNLELDMPNVRIVGQNENLQLSGFKLETNQGLNAYALEPGESKVSFDHIKMTGNQLNTSTRGEFKNFRFETRTALAEHVVNTRMSLRLDEMAFAGIPSMRDIHFNFDVNDVNKSKLLNLLKLMEVAEQNCVPQTAWMKDLEPALVGIMNEGFSFASDDNQIKVGQGFAKAQINGRVMPSHHSSLKTLFKTMPTLIEYQSDMQFDKNLVTALMRGYLGGRSAGTSDQDIERILATMQEAGQLKRDGDIFKMAVKYKYGEKQFLTE